MTILGWQLNIWSDAAVHLILWNLLFILSWAISQFSYIGLIKYCFWVQILDIFYSIYPTYLLLLILTSMIAGNIVEIRLPQIQNRKCLRKSNIWRYRAENVFGNLISMILDRRGYQHKPDCDYKLPKTLLGIYFSTNTEYDI
jgi:hypothetical protein